MQLDSSNRNFNNIKEEIILISILKKIKTHLYSSYSKQFLENINEHIIQNNIVKLLDINSLEDLFEPGPNIPNYKITDLLYKSQKFFDNIVLGEDFFNEEYNSNLMSNIYNKYYEKQNSELSLILTENEITLKVKYEYKIRTLLYKLLEDTKIDYEYIKNKENKENNDNKYVKMENMVFTFTIDKNDKNILNMFSKLMYFLVEIITFEKNNVRICNIDIFSKKYKYNCVLILEKIFNDKDDVISYKGHFIDPFGAVHQKKNVHGIEMKNIIQSFIELNSTLNKHKPKHLLPIDIILCSQILKKRKDESHKEIPSYLYNMFYCDCLFDILKTVKCLSEQENFIDLENNNYKNKDLKDISIEYILKNIQQYLNNIQSIIKINIDDKIRNLSTEEYDYFFMKYLFNQYYFFISRFTENSNNIMYEKIRKYLETQQRKYLLV